MDAYDPSRDREDIGSEIMDIETIIEKIKSTVQANLPTYIAAMNTKKGDSLLSDIPSDAFYQYKLPGISVMPMYPVSVLQYITGADIDSSINGGTSIRWSVAMDVICTISASNDATDERRLLRYQEVIRRISEEKIMPIFPNMTITLFAPTFGSDGSNQMFGIGQILLSHSIA